MIRFFRLCVEPAAVNVIDEFVSKGLEHRAKVMGVLHMMKNDLDAFLLQLLVAPLDELFSKPAFRWIDEDDVLKCSQ